MSWLATLWCFQRIPVSSVWNFLILLCGSRTAFGYLTAKETKLSVEPTVCALVS
jgi:hypothetical protein